PLGGRAGGVVAGGAAGQRRVKRLPMGAAAVLLLAACNGGLTLPSGREAAAESPGPTANASTLERQIHDLVNNRRSATNRPGLRWDDRVAAIAREHSQAMASGRRPFSHDGFDQRAEQIAALLTVRALAEHVAYDSR